MSNSIGMVLDSFYPADIRVQKEAAALTNAGFKVSLLCKRRAGEAKYEELDGIQIMRINAGTTNTAKGIYDVLLAISFVHPTFKRNLGDFINKFSTDIIHVHDLPLVKTVYQIASKRGIPVVADFHENYPEALKVWFQWKKNPAIRFKNKLFFGYQRWFTYEKWAVNHVQKVIAVVEEMRDRLNQDHHLPKEKIVVVSNTESKSFVKSRLDESIYAEDKDKFIVAYTGGVGPHRGVDTLIEAMGLLKDKADIILFITGTASRAANDAMQQAITKYNIGNKVRVLGYKPFDQFYSYMKMAKVNVIPHHRNGHTDNTVPHKLFQCMMAGNPLVVSSSTPLERIVNMTNSGLVFKAGDAEDLADKILTLYGDHELSRQLAENGQQATLKGEYNWESTGRLLVNFYKEIC